MKNKTIETYKPVVAQPHTPPYKIHRYFARRPWNVFKQLIEVFSKPNDIVLDPFCGGGVTIYEGIKLNRNIVGLDLNPLSIFIVKNMIRKGGCLAELEKAVSLIYEYLQFLYGDFNQISMDLNNKSISREKVPILWNELAFKVYCNYCNKEILLSNENKLANGRYYCSNKSCVGCKKNNGYVEPKNCKRNGYQYLYSVVLNAPEKKRVEIKCSTQRVQGFNDHIKFLKNQIRKNKIKIPKDKIPLDWDRQYEDLLFQKGIKYFQELFTKKNLLINLLLLDYIKKLDVGKETCEVLRLIFSSSLRDSNIMAFTNESWQSGSPTTWSKHAYWIPSQFCEVDVLTSFKKAFNRVKASLIFNEQFSYDVVPVKKIETIKLSGNLFLSNTLIGDCKIPENFIDTIITDPPYGSNVQYLELSHFWYVWNYDLYSNEIPDFSKEAVSNRKKDFNGAKNMKSYENNLFAVFKKSYKVLKPKGCMVLTFNNKDMGAWLALLISIFRAGFVFKKSSLFFQEGVNNYKQTAHTKYEGSPYGDFIYVFVKNIKKSMPKTKINEDVLIKQIDVSFKEHLAELRRSELNRDTIKKQMFLDVIPRIEKYVNSNIKDISKHQLYSYFNKNYLKKLYH